MDKEVMKENLSVSVSHVIRYINEMVPKDKRTLQSIYPAAMSEAQKNYIISHLQYILDNIE